MKCSCKCSCGVVDLQAAWDARHKLYAEADKPTAEANKLDAEAVTLEPTAEARKLYAEADKLTAEGDLIWINAWIRVHGKGSIVDWDWGAVK